MPDFVPVQNITGVITQAVVGTPIALTGTVAPTNATNKTITWSVVSGPGNIINGNQLAATGSGQITVRATIINGTLQ